MNQRHECSILSLDSIRTSSTGADKCRKRSGRNSASDTRESNDKPMKRLVMRNKHRNQTDQHKTYVVVALEVQDCEVG